MGLFWNILSFLAGYEAGNWLSQMRERRDLYDLAVKAARGRPVLVVGNAKGRHPEGSVCIDLSPAGVCMKADVQDLRMFPDNAFGAAYVGHVLEHVDNPAKAWAELHRVAEHVFIAYPHRHSLIAWFHPTHKWILVEVPQGMRGPRSLRYTRNPVHPFFRELLSPGPSSRSRHTSRRDTLPLSPTD